MNLLEQLILILLQIYFYNGVVGRVNLASRLFQNYEVTLGLFLLSQHKGWVRCEQLIYTILHTINDKYFYAVFVYLNHPGGHI